MAHKRSEHFACVVNGFPNRTLVMIIAAETVTKNVDEATSTPKLITDTQKSLLLNAARIETSSSWCCVCASALTRSKSKLDIRTLRFAPVQTGTFRKSRLLYWFLFVLADCCQHT